MAYLMRDGDPGQKAMALYARCEDELLAKAELVLLAEEAAARWPGQRVIAYLDVDPSYTITRFKRSYRDDYIRYRRLMDARRRIVNEGWNFPEVSMDGTR